MKLSEQLIKTAEWWLDKSGDIILDQDGNSHMFNTYHGEYHALIQRESLRHRWDYTGISYLCLLEAELQKDIECLNEMLEVFHS